MIVYCPFSPSKECNCTSKVFVTEMQNAVVTATITENTTLNLTEEQALKDYQAALKDIPLSSFERIPASVTQNCPNCSVAVIMVKKN